MAAGFGEGLPGTALLQGRVFCATEEVDRLLSVLSPLHHEHIWGFRSRDVGVFLLLRSRYSEAVFLDERLRGMELQFKGRTNAAGILEVEAIRSIRNGVVQDLYYYCNVCAIKSVAPEICSCCQGPVELVERPLMESEE